MKVGILVECGRQGLESVVCGRLCELLSEHTGVEFEFDIMPMDNKKNLILECGTATKNLFASGCDRVVILWDERPAWPKKDDKLCWHNDRQDILANLRENGVELQNVHLVCIEREFESWLLFDERMLSGVLSTDSHKVKIRRQKNPDRMPNPKGTMTSLFQRNGGKRYVDIQFARDFARNLDDLARLKRCTTFQRFGLKVTGRTI